MVTRPVTTNDILDGHVTLDIECLDRIYLNGYVPNLQVGGQVVQYLAKRGFPIPSPVVVGRIGDRFRDAVRRFTAVNHIPVVRFVKGERKIAVMTRYLRAQAATGRSGVAAVGVAQEFQRVATCTTRQARDGGAPHFGWDRADRRVSCFYFYVWDQDFGPGFIKICAYFPYPIKVCLLTELREESSLLRGQVRACVATVPAHDYVRRSVPGPALLGGSPARRAGGQWGSVRAVPAA
jgi:hypothetical protein